MRRFFRSEGLNPRPPLRRQLLSLSWWAGAAECATVVAAVLVPLYVFGAWMLHFLLAGEWWWSVAMGASALILWVGAINRVPIAWIVLGGAGSTALSLIYSPTVIMGLLP